MIPSERKPSAQDADYGSRYYIESEMIELDEASRRYVDGRCDWDESDHN